MCDRAEDESRSGAGAQWTSHESMTVRRRTVAMGGTSSPPLMVMVEVETAVVSWTSTAGHRGIVAFRGALRNDILVCEGEDADEENVAVSYGATRHRGVETVDRIV